MRLLNFLCHIHMNAIPIMKRSTPVRDHFYNIFLVSIKYFSFMIE